MRRRDFIKTMGAAAAAAAAWPVAARAQRARPVLGFLGSGEPSTLSSMLAGFAAGLKEAGFVDGQNLTIEYRWAEGRFERLPALATELVERRVDVIMAAQGTVSARAAQGVTATVPVDFVTVDDPVTDGLVASLNRPGGNLTGVSRLGTILGAKNLELVHEVVPTASRIGLLANPKRPTAEAQRRNVEEAAAVLGKTIRVLDGSSEAAIEAAFKTIESERIGALLVPFDPVLNIHRRQIIALAARYRIPAAYALREFMADGGLMSYGDSTGESYGLAAGYVDRILKGEKPADLPVQAPVKYELVINLKAAKALGLEVPDALLARADEVIE